MSDRPQLLFNYFKQLFAQVTNPPIDSIREEDLVMSLDLAVGKPRRTCFAETPEHARLLGLDQPILSNAQLAKIREVTANGWASRTLSCATERRSGGAGLDRALERICAEATAAVAQGVEI